MVTSIKEKIKKLFDRKNFAIWGIIASILLILALFIPQIGYIGRNGESYSMLNHFISELGELGVSHLAAIFNIGIFVAGILYIPFMVGLGRYLDNKIAKLGAVIGLFSCVCASLVGIFPMNYLVPHAIVALLFFMGAMITVGIFSISILIIKEQKISKILGLLGLVVVAIYIPFFSIDFGDMQNMGNLKNAFKNRPNVWILAVLEWAMALAILGYLCLIAIYFQYRLKKNI